MTRSRRGPTRRPGRRRYRRGTCDLPTMSGGRAPFGAGGACRSGAAQETTSRKKPQKTATNRNKPKQAATRRITPSGRSGGREARRGCRREGEARGEGRAEKGNVKGRERFPTRSWDGADRCCGLLSPRRLISVVGAASDEGRVEKGPGSQDRLHPESRRAAEIASILRASKSARDILNSLTPELRGCQSHTVEAPHNRGGT